MGLFDNWPYTNFHELNLTWLLRRMEDLSNIVENFVIVDDNDINLLYTEDVEDDYSSELQNALDDASFAYFEGMLKQTLCQEFAIAEDDLRVRVEWAGTGMEMRPQKVTVILSGKAIWKDPAKIEGYVTSLLDCDCVSAIE